MEDESDECSVEKAGNGSIPKYVTDVVCFDAFDVVVGGTTNATSIAFGALV